VSSDRSLIQVTGDGRSVCIGRYLRPEWRPSLARELRAAVLSHRGAAVLPSSSH
jgi:uncharacterized membrane protein